MSAVAQSIDRALAALRRKLERAELEHLRQHCLELHLELERVELELQRAQDEEHNAKVIADMWQQQAESLDEQLHAEGREPVTIPAMTADGRLGIVNAQGHA